MEWKLIGSVTGPGTSIPLQIDTYNDFLIIIGTPIYKWSWYFTKKELNTFIPIGSCIAHPSTNQITQYVRGQISASNEVELSEVWQNNANNTSNGILIVYGK